MKGWICIVFFFLLRQGSLFSQPAFEKQMNDFLAQPEYRHAQVGIQITEAKTGRIIHEINGGKLFIPASVMKLDTSASALEMPGPVTCRPAAATDIHLLLWSTIFQERRVTRFPIWRTYFQILI